MRVNRNRKDGSPEIAGKATVYLNGRKQNRCIEARTMGPFLKGPGYVIRYSKTGTRKYMGVPVEKAYGLVDIRL